MQTFEFNEERRRWCKNVVDFAMEQFLNHVILFSRCQSINCEKKLKAYVSIQSLVNLLI